MQRFASSGLEAPCGRRSMNNNLDNRWGEPSNLRNARYKLAFQLCGETAPLKIALTLFFGIESGEFGFKERGNPRISIPG